MVYVLHHEIVTGRLVLCDGSKTGTKPKCCYDCKFWVGRCKRGKVNRIAKDVACELFKPKNGKFEPICDFLRYTK